MRATGAVATAASPDGREEGLGQARPGVPRSRRGTPDRGHSKRPEKLISYRMVGNQARHRICRRNTPNRRAPGVSTWGERFLAIVLLTVTAAAIGPACAGAEVGAGPYPTSQAVAADAQFLEYAPPPAHPGVVCLVDSGVDPNPDTNAAVVGAEARDPTWGTGDGLALTQPPIEGHPDGHGTEMAMLMAAPQNGWGMVGIAPTAVRVYSVRVVPAGETAFPFANYTYAINRCLQLHLTSESAIQVINLSFAGTQAPSSDSVAQFEDTVDNARHHGINVVAASGSSAATDPVYPAAYASVFAVGAGDAAAGTDASCGFSTGSVIELVAPGCNSIAGGIDEAFEDDGEGALGFGTSQAAALVSAVLAAMRAYAPTVTDLQAEACLTASADSAGHMDAAAAFTACGLRRIVEAGLAGVPTSSQPSGGASDGNSPTTGGTPQALPGFRPSIRPPRIAFVFLAGNRLKIDVLNRPKKAIIELKLLRKGRGRLVVVARRSSASRTATLRRDSASFVAVRFVLRGNATQSSPWTTKAIV